MYPFSARLSGRFCHDVCIQRVNPSQSQTTLELPLLLHKSLHPTWPAPTSRNERKGMYVGRHLQQMHVGVDSRGCASFMPTGPPSCTAWMHHLPMYSTAQYLGEADRLKRAAASQTNRVAPPAAAWRFPPARPTHLQLDQTIVFRPVGRERC